MKDFSSGIGASITIESIGPKLGEELVMIPILIRKKNKTYGEEKFLISGLRMKLMPRLFSMTKLPPIIAPSSGYLTRSFELITYYYT
jgi:hypothetical protein